MFIYIQNITHSFHMILHFEKSSNMIDQEHLGKELKNQNFAKW